MIQRDLFTARKERDKKIESVTVNAHEGFHRRMREVIMDIFRVADYFTSDDVWNESEKRGPIPGYTSDPRALGGILKQMQKEGIIKPTDRWKESTRRHAAPIKIWAFTNKPRQQ